MNQLDFDLAAGNDLKEIGIQRASQAKPEALLYAKSLAIRIAESRENRTCSIDDIQRVLIPEGIVLGKAAGAVFRGNNWKLFGHKKSTRISNHSRPISIWELK